MKLFIWYSGFLIILFIFYKVATIVYNYLERKGPNVEIYAHPALFYIIGIPFFVFLFWNDLKPFIFYNLFYLYGFCSLKNSYNFKNWISKKTKYSLPTTIIIIYTPIFIIILSQAAKLDSHTIIIEYLSLVLLSIMHIFITIKFYKR